jgi:multiple sugar transport system permease protein
MEQNDRKAWLYLLPAIAFLGVFMVYPLIDVFIYSLEEGFNFASQSYMGVGLYNYSYILHDPYFMQAVKNLLSRLVFVRFTGTEIERSNKKDIGRYALK